jgi:hypothetical protein
MVVAIPTIEREANNPATVIKVTNARPRNTCNKWNRIGKNN